MPHQICFICNIASEICQKNFTQMKSQYSGYPLIIFIKKFIRKSHLVRDINNSDNCICQICLVQVNEYDSICVKAKRIEDELHRKLIESDTVWKSKPNSNDNTRSNEHIQIERKESNIKANNNDDRPNLDHPVQNVVSFSSPIENHLNSY